jgi:isopropylmalate/homocitrate/citramalate synthase
MSRVTVCDVAPRDGLQNDDTVLEPRVRAELVDRLAAAGLPRVEAVSFVNPARVPQMAGAEEVVAALERRPGVVYAGLVLNDRGYDRLAATGLDEAHFAFSATEAFNQRNQGTTVAESVESAGRIVARAHEDGIRATVTIGVAFGCPLEGAVDPEHVLRLAARISEFGPNEIVLADTVGVGTPGRVGRLVASVTALGLPVGVHLHNTRNTGLANAYAAVEAGATVLDASVGGIGGCPFEGHVDPGRVAEHCARLEADEIVLADTIGVATPRRVADLVGRVADGRPVGVHLHNTRNTGYANAVAALEAGATVFDASVGGLGGCPYAPRATGNIATEDLVYLLEGDGIDTGVDLDALVAVSEWLESVLGRPLEGQVYRAGPFPSRATTEAESSSISSAE